MDGQDDRSLPERCLSVEHIFVFVDIFHENMENLETHLSRLHAALVSYSFEERSDDVAATGSTSLKWKALIELSHSVQDACRELANTQAFVRNRQNKLEDAVDHLRALVVGDENGPGSMGMGDADRKTPALQSPLGIVAAVEAKLEQYRMETKCAEELLVMRTSEIEALRRTSQRTLHDLTALYKARMSETNQDYQLQIRQANERAELARNQSAGLQEQLENALYTLRKTEGSRHAEVDSLKVQMDSERCEWTSRIETLEMRLHDSSVAQGVVQNKLIEAVAAKEALEQKLSETQELLSTTREQTKQELAQMHADIDAFENEAKHMEDTVKKYNTRVLEMRALIDIKEHECEHLQASVEAKTEALEQARETFARHRRIFENQLESLKARAAAAEEAREQVERELQRLQLDRVSAVLSDEAIGAGAEPMREVESAGVSSTSSERHTTTAEDSFSFVRSPADGCGAEHSAAIACVMAESAEKLRLKDAEIDNLKEALRVNQIDLDMAVALLSAMSDRIGVPATFGGSGWNRHPQDDARRRITQLEVELEKTVAEKNAALTALAQARAEARRIHERERDAEESVKVQRRSVESMNSRLKSFARGTIALYTAFEESKQNATLAALGQQLQTVELDSVLASSELHKLDTLLTPLKNMDLLYATDEQHPHHSYVGPDGHRSRDPVELPSNLSFSSV